MGWDEIKNLRPQDVPRWNMLDFNLIRAVDQLITILGVTTWVIASTFGFSRGKCCRGRRF